MEERLKAESEALIKLIRAAVTDAQICDGDFSQVSWKKLYTLSKLHETTGVVCFALKKYNISVPEDVTELFLKTNKVGIYRTASQITCTELISGALSEADIPFMLLKGSVLRSLYPSDEMRVSGDVDILYDERVADEEKIENIMNSAGFTKTKGSKTVDTFTAGTTVFEMHRQLCSENDGRFLPPEFENILDYSKSKDGGAEKVMSDEDFYIFHIAHMAKHFCSHGCGIRPLIDLYLLIKNKNKLDGSYIDKKLEETKLKQFEAHVKSLALSLFDGKPLDKDEELLLNVMMYSGIYGNSKRSAVNERARIQSGKQKVPFFIKSAFLPIENMRVKYPILKKAPILLPIMWVYRAADVVLHKSQKIKSSVSALNSVEQSELDESIDLLKSLGLEN